MMPSNFYESRYANIEPQEAVFKLLGPLDYEDSNIPGHSDTLSHFCFTATKFNKSVTGREQATARFVQKRFRSQGLDFLVNEQNRSGDQELYMTVFEVYAALFDFNPMTGEIADRFDWSNPDDAIKAFKTYRNIYFRYHQSKERSREPDLNKFRVYFDLAGFGFSDDEIKKAHKSPDLMLDAIPAKEASGKKAASSEK